MVYYYTVDFNEYLSTHVRIYIYILHIIRLYIIIIIIELKFKITLNIQSVFIWEFQIRNSKRHKVNNIAINNCVIISIPH